MILKIPAHQVIIGNYNNIITVLKLKKIIKLTNILHLNQEIFTKEDQNKGKTRVYCFLALQKENVMCSSRKYPCLSHKRVVLRPSGNPK